MSKSNNSSGFVEKILKSAINNIDFPFKSTALHKISHLYKFTGKKCIQICIKTCLIAN